MKITKLEDWALLLVAELAKNYLQAPLSLSHIAREHGISFLYLKKITRDLKKAGLIESREGVRGGYSLSRLPQGITVWDVLQAVSSPVSQKKEQLASRGDCPLVETCLPQEINALMHKVMKNGFSQIPISAIGKGVW